MVTASKPEDITKDSGDNLAPKDKLGVVIGPSPVRGKKVRAEAEPVSDTQKLAVIDRFRSKYGEIERYYRKLDVAIAVTI